MVGTTIIGIVMTVIFVLCTLSFIVGLFKHLIYREWEDIWISLLGTLVFVGLVLMILNI